MNAKVKLFGRADNIRTSTDQREFILQTFNGREYEDEERGPRKVVEALFERLRGSRRIVLASKARPAKPSWRFGSRRGPIGVTDGSKARMQSTVMQYLDWAQRAGLRTVAVYPGTFGERNAVRFERRAVAVSDFLGDAPAAEIES